MMADNTQVPHHIAIIMDGNGRWAKQRHQPRFMGHSAGVKSVEAIVKQCMERDVSVLSLFAFSSENWRRPSKEVGLLMELFALSLKQQAKRLHTNNIRLNIIGDISKFSTSLQKQITQATQLTKNNTRFTINIAANYGGRWDITQSVRRLAERVKARELSPEDITEKIIATGLTTASLPEPDLFIRTGGEQRVSNFLIWQLAYTEFYFTDTLWPDFDSIELDNAITSFGQRERRFGRTSEQLQDLLPMLKQRLLTAAILIPLVVLSILYLSTSILQWLLAVVVMLAAIEWFAIIGFNRCKTLLGLVVLVGVASSGLLLSLSALSLITIAVWGLVLLMMGFYAHTALPEQLKRLFTRPMVGLFVGAVVLALFWNSAVQLHHSTSQGPQPLLYVTILVWLADTGGYFAGKKWGAKPLAKAVSPNKTWEGVVGALVLGSIWAITAYLLGLSGYIDLISWLLLSVISLSISIVGDLFESLFKRLHQVKESGHLLPGHGGMLDRIDGLIAAVPIFTAGSYILEVW